MPRKEPPLLMEDLVKLLRANANEPFMSIGGRPFAIEAANEIERLRAALQKIADLIDTNMGEPLDEAIEIATKALRP